MKMRWAIPAVLMFAAKCAFGQQPAWEIVDESTGTHWALMKDAAHPGGPGRLVVDRSPRAMRQVVIRAGDRVLVEEHTDRVDLRLEGVVLSPAAVGETFAVRLRVGGNVVRARALAAGRAELAAEGNWR
jgi:hypothetical protein